MGSRIARRLIDAGYPVGVYNRTRDKTRVLGERGARVYDSPRELAADADTVLSMLADDAAVEQVMLGPDGIVAAARPDSTIIDLSSVHPDTTDGCGTSTPRTVRAEVTEAPHCSDQRWRWLAPRIHHKSRDDLVALVTFF
jgi:3-hydroxyisobutyrate dehydrogenase-like beta-hydroxyacid dehydrogenase